MAPFSRIQSPPQIGPDIPVRITQQGWAQPHHRTLLLPLEESTCSHQGHANVCLPPNPRQTLESSVITVAWNDAHEVTAWSPQGTALQPAADFDSTEGDQPRRFRLDIV